MNMNVSLTDELSEFVKTKVASGRYTSASEVVREALRIMEQTEEARLAFLRNAWAAGQASYWTGVFPAVLLLAVGVVGWVVLLALVFAATHVTAINTARRHVGEFLVDIIVRARNAIFFGSTALPL